MSARLHFGRRSGIFFFFMLEWNMGNKYVPVLGPIGFTNEPNLMGNVLLKHFLVANFSQSSLYQGNVSSMAYVLHLGGEDIDTVVSELTSTLSTYYGRYFDHVNVEVTEVDDGTQSSNAAITLFIEYGDEDSRYKLYYSIQILDGEVKDLIKLSNYGSTT